MNTAANYKFYVYTDDTLMLYVNSASVGNQTCALSQRLQPDAVCDFAMADAAVPRPPGSVDSCIAMQPAPAVHVNTFSMTPRLRLTRSLTACRLRTKRPVRDVCEVSANGAAPF